jgi:anti-sigma B factor antagonist
MNEDLQQSPVKSVQWQGQTCVVTIAGDVNIHCSLEFQRDLLSLVDKKPRRIALDLGGVAFMDSSGVASLIKLLSAAKKSHIELRLAALDERVRGIFEVTRLNTVFKICDSLEEALA